MSYKYRGYGTERVFDVKRRLRSQSHLEDRGFDTPCLIFDGEKDRDGYGRIKDHGKYRPAHQIFMGEPPFAGAEIDHLCKQRDCVRPTHLEWVTRVENMKRRHGTSDGR